MLRLSFHQISKAVRSEDWGTSFLPFILGGVYLWMVILQLPLHLSLLLYGFMSLITASGFAAFGYFINEYFDRKSDAAAGKVNRMNQWSFSERSWLLMGILIFTFLPWMFLPTNALSWVLIILQLSLFLLYSSPFVRWKNHLVLGPITDGMYAYTVPCLLSFHTFSLIPEAVLPDNRLWFFCLIAMCWFMGIRNILDHQLKDRFADMKAGESTLAVCMGKVWTRDLLQLVFAYELFFVLMWMGYLTSTDLRWLILPLSMLIWSGLGLYLQKIKLEKVVAHGWMNRWYQQVFPICVLILWIWNTGSYVWLILCIHGLFFLPYELHQFLRDGMTDLFLGLKQIFWSFQSLVRGFLSAAVNWPIYFLFRLFGVDLIQERCSAWTYVSKRWFKDQHP